MPFLKLQVREVGSGCHTQDRSYDGFCNLEQSDILSYLLQAVGQTHQLWYTDVYTRDQDHWEPEDHGLRAEYHRVRGWSRTGNAALLSAHFFASAGSVV